MALLPAHLLQHLEAHILLCQLLLGKFQVLGLLRRKGMWTQHRERGSLTSSHETPLSQGAQAPNSKRRGHSKPPEKAGTHSPRIPPQ